MSHAQGQNNINKVNSAWERMRSYFHTDVPRSRATITNLAYAMSNKRSF